MKNSASKQQDNAKSIVLEERGFMINDIKALLARAQQAHRDMKKLAAVGGKIRASSQPALNEVCVTVDVLDYALWKLRSVVA